MGNVGVPVLCAAPPPRAWASNIISMLLDLLPPIYALFRPPPFTPPPTLTRAGTIVNSSEDVLDALDADGRVEVPARVQQDLVAIVKTVYALTHTARLPHIQRLASDVVRSLTASDAAAAGSIPAAVQVREFWTTEFSIGSPAGRRWRALVQLAHVDTPGVAARVWGDSGAGAPGLLSYDEAVRQLECQLGELVCPR